MESREAPISEVLEEVFEGFDDRLAIRRLRASESRDDPDRVVYAIPSDQGRQPRLRRERLERILGTEEAIAIVVGAEAWSSGAQLIFVTKPPPK